MENINNSFDNKKTPQNNSAPSAALLPKKPPAPPAGLPKPPPAPIASTNAIKQNQTATQAQTKTVLETESKTAQAVSLNNNHNKTQAENNNKHTLKKQKVNNKKNKNKKDDLTNKNNVNLNAEELAGQNSTKNTKKRKKMSKKMLILLIITSFIICLGVAGGVYWYILENKKIETPVVSIYSLDSQTILSVAHNDRAVRYEFYIQRIGAITFQTVASDSSEISLLGVLKQPASYRIWAKYIGKNNNATSNESAKKIFDYYEQLESPTISIVGDDLVWTPIVQAKFYQIHFSTNNGLSDSIDVVAPEGYQNPTYKLLDISTYGANSYTIYVIACGEPDGFYTNSELSNSVTYQTTTTLGDPYLATFYSATKTLTFKVDEATNPNLNYLIVINDGEITQGFVTQTVLQQYTMDLTPYLPHNFIIRKITVQACGDGVFFLNSRIVTAVLM